MAFRIEPVGSGLTDDLGRLFGADHGTAGCWCMWFVVPVKDYHRAGRGGNRSSFCDLMAASAEPLGLLAYQGDEPVGWCAVGPRSRYARALKTPTYRGGPGEDGRVWLVPCFFLRKAARGTGLGRALLQAAVGLAQRHGAQAIEGFPLTGDKRRSADLQVGFESVFAACGFEPISRPSPSGVVMRRDLAG